MSTTNSPVLPGNRPDFTSREEMQIEVPTRFIAPVYPENIARMTLCVSFLQILNPDILFWPVVDDEMNQMREECKEHPDWFMMDLDNSIEKLIARTWRLFDPKFFVNQEAASRIAVKLGRAADRECTTVNSVMTNMLYSVYTELELDGIIYADGNLNIVKMSSFMDDPEAIRERLSEKILEVAIPLQTFLERYIRTMNREFINMDKLEKEIAQAKEADDNWVLIEPFYPITSAMRRRLQNDPDIKWAIQIEPDCWNRGHVILFPMTGPLGKSALQAIPTDKFKEWVEATDEITRANPNIRDAIEFRTVKGAIEGIKTIENELAQF